MKGREKGRGNSYVLAPGSWFLVPFSNSIHHFITLDNKL